MVNAELTIHPPEATWIYKISTKYPDVLFKVVAVITRNGSGIGLLELSTDKIEDILLDLKDINVSIDIIEQKGEKVLLRFETSNPLPIIAAKKSGVPVETPFYIKNGKIKWEISAPRKNISKLREKLDKLSLKYEIDRIVEIPDSEKLLTDRQQEVLLKAVKRGYYETPRKTSLSNISDELGIAKSTCSQIIHRAEEKIVKKFIENEMKK